MRVRRLIAIGTLAVTVGCSSVQRVPLDYIAVEQPAEIRLVNSYGMVTTIYNPRVSGDTVYGKAIGKGEVAVPLQQIEGISTYKFDKGRTVLLVGGGIAVTALGAWALFGGSSGDTKIECDYTTRALEQNGGAPICRQV